MDNPSVPEWYKLLGSSQEGAREQLSAQHESLVYGAFMGCLKGDLKPLSKAIKEGALNIDAGIAKNIVGMIDKDPALSDYVLEIKKNRDVGQKNTSHQKLLAANKSKKIATYVALMRGHEHGQHDAAISEAATKFGMKKSRINDCWGRYLREKDSYARHLAWSKTKEGLKAFNNMDLETGFIPSPPDDFMLKVPKGLRNTVIDEHSKFGI